eukprot:1023308-Amphidinium_carterae.1
MSLFELVSALQVRDWPNCNDCGEGVLRERVPKDWGSNTCAACLSRNSPLHQPHLPLAAHPKDQQAG